MPGSELSAEPAIEGPASTKATASMKLRVRIFDGLRACTPALSAVVLAELITIGGFQSSAPQAKNGFVASENCFVGCVPTTQSLEKSNDFSEMQP
jgi:hypothetical protein